MIVVLLGLLAGAPPPGGVRTIEAITPAIVDAGKSHKIWVRGRGFKGGDKVWLDGAQLPTEWVSSSTVVAVMRAHPPGYHAVTVGRPGVQSFPVPLGVRPPPPVLVPMPPMVVEEEGRLELEVSLFSGGPETRVFAEALPPGAQWIEAHRRLLFAPDFTQGGQTHRVLFTARAPGLTGVVTATASVEIEVVDTIRPIEPLVREVRHTRGWSRIVLDQRTDGFTSGPPWLGKTYPARICVATGTRTASHPVRIFLHGAEAEMPDGCVRNEHRIYPADPDTTYWWGYGYPGVPRNYTQRRVLQLLEWVLDTFPSADPERVYLEGTSMGGAGALSLALIHPHHFAMADTYWAQSVPRHQRPGRLKSLDELWGPPPPVLDAQGGNPWDLQDVTRLLAERPQAREQFVFVRHGKDDPVIHFGAAVRPSPITEQSLYEMLEGARAGHYVVWDEAGHGPPDPVLGKRWWDGGWDRIHDPITFLRRDLAFPAFSASSANDDPGDGQPLIARPWDPTRGYSGRVGVPGDSGWNGAIAGVMNRWLRWDARRIVDTVDRLEIPLFTRVDATARPPPRPGYPPLEDGRVQSGPIVVAVTPRRVQRFRCMPGERIAWSFGAQQGEAIADADGAVTVLGLEITPVPQALVLVRRPD